MNLQVLNEVPLQPVTDVLRRDAPVFGKSRSDDRPAVMVIVARLSVGGAEAHTRALVNELSDEFRIVFVTLKPGVPPFGEVRSDRLAAWEQLDIGTGFNRQAPRQLAELIDRHRVDVVLCTNPYPLAYAQLARRRAGRRVRVLGVFHSTVMLTRRDQIEMLVYRPFYWLAEGLIYVCEAQRRYCSRRALWARSVEVIHNGVDLQRFDAGALPQGGAEARRAYGLAVDDRVVGICAALRPEKAHLHLLEAVAMQHRQGHPWKLLIIGDGVMRGEIEARVRDLGLEAHVRLLGALADVRPAVLGCDVMALPSVAVETFSISALESMALGKPMVMSDTGGAREQVIDGRNGYVFQPGDIAGLAASLDACWPVDETVRMGREAEQVVREQFSLRAMLDKYRHLLREHLLLVAQSRLG